LSEKFKNFLIRQVKNRTTTSCVLSLSEKLLRNGKLEEKNIISVIWRENPNRLLGLLGSNLVTVKNKVYLPRNSFVKSLKNSESQWNNGTVEVKGKNTDGATQKKVDFDQENYLLLGGQENIVTNRMNAIIISAYLLKLREIEAREVYQKIFVLSFSSDKKIASTAFFWSKS
jgi:hypothetical protein